MTGLLIALGIIVVLMVIAAGYRRWKRGPRPETVRGPTYRQMKEEQRQRAEKHSGGWSGGAGGGF